MPPTYIKPLISFPTFQLTSLKGLCVLSPLKCYFETSCPTLCYRLTEKFLSPSPPAYFCMQQDFAHAFLPRTLHDENPSLLFFYQSILQILFPKLLSQAVFSDLPTGVKSPLYDLTNSSVTLFTTAILHFWCNYVISISLPHWTLCSTDAASISSFAFMTPPSQCSAHFRWSLHTYVKCIKY